MIPPEGVGLQLSRKEIFPDSTDNDIYLDLVLPSGQVTYFIGQNGTGKSRTAKRLAEKIQAHHLSTDRLIGMMKFTSYEFGSVLQDYRGVPVDATDQDWSIQTSNQAGTATQELYALRDHPDVALRVAAFIQAAIGRRVELRESSGFLDPVVRIGATEYSLFRDEGHGLRELVALLTAVYRDDWSTLVVDEPELHLHPAMTRLWAAELVNECGRTNRSAVVVTHEPSLVKPSSCDELDRYFHFQAGRRPLSMSEAVLPVQRARVTASLQKNRDLVSTLAFSPRPVLVEGPTDVAALTAALARVGSASAFAQTDFISCDGSGGLALWREITDRLQMNCVAVADLDVIFSPDMQRCMDNCTPVVQSYKNTLFENKTADVVRPLIRRADAAGVPSDPKSRAAWAVNCQGTERGRRDSLIRIWAENGVWVHPQGTLEQVLQVSEKSVEAAKSAASAPGELDIVATWCSYALDPSGDLELLLNVTIEGLAHRILEAQRADPAVSFSYPVNGGPGASRLVEVEPLPEQRHRITVRLPREFSGYFVEFSRDTPPSELTLHPPKVAES